MSLNRKKYKEHYSRVREQKQANKDYQDELNDDIYGTWARIDSDYFSDEMFPTMKEVSCGKMLTLLVKLKIRYSKQALDGWYW